MCSDRWLEEREYQFDLADLQTKRSMAVSTSLTIITVAASFVILELSLPPSLIKAAAIVTSLLLSLMAIGSMRKSVNEIKQEKEKIYQKYIDKYRTEEKDENNKD